MGTECAVTSNIVITDFFFENFTRLISHAVSITLLYLSFWEVSATDGFCDMSKNLAKILDILFNM